VAAAYGRLKRLVADRFVGIKNAEVALSVDESDPETWRAPLAKTLAATGTIADESVIVAAQQLMALLDAAGTQAGKYDVDLRGAQIAARQRAAGECGSWTRSPRGGVTTGAVGWRRCGSYLCGDERTERSFVRARQSGRGGCGIHGGRSMSCFY
jgi:hypothetical protein